MKEKLEAVTGDDSRKNSVRSNVSSENGEPRKRSEINLKVGGNVLKISIFLILSLSPSLTKFLWILFIIHLLFQSLLFWLHINTSGDGAISQAASADDIIMATDEKGGNLDEKKRLLIKQKLGGGKFQMLYLKSYFPWFYVPFELSLQKYDTLWL